MIKKIIKSKLFWIIVALIVVIVAIIIKFAAGQGKVEYSTEKSKNGNIIQSVSATGSIKAATEVEASFPSSGRLVEILVDVGDAVLSGQILARLDGTSLQTNVAKASANLAAADADLKRLRVGATSEDVAVLEATVSKYTAELENAKNDIENTKAYYNQNLVNKRQSALSEINDSVTKADISLQTVYDTVYFEGSSDYLKVEGQLKTDTIINYQEALNLEIEVKNDYIVASRDLNDQNIDNAIKNTLNYIDAVSVALDATANALDGAISHTDMTQTEIDTLKASINTRRTTTDTSFDSLQTARQNLENARIDLKTKVDTATQTADSAVKTLEKSKADLSLKIAPPRPEDILWYEAKVKQARADLAYAQDKYNETVLKSPVDGIITMKNNNLGEYVGGGAGAQSAVFKILSAGSYEISVDIPESDIAKIQINSSVDITLDAFTEDDVFKGIITKVDPAQTVMQDVVYYKVTVTFISEQAGNIAQLMNSVKPGMTANLTILIDSKENVLIVPQRSVKEIDGKRIVQVLINNQPVNKEVVVGLKGSDGMIEIISGIQADEEVITFIKQN